MAWLQYILWGARVWVWLLTLLNLLVIFLVTMWLMRERIRYHWHNLRNPESLVKVVMHYNANMFKVFWRLMPSTGMLKLGDKRYSFDEKKLRKSLDIISAKKKGNDKLKFEIDGKTYDYLEVAKVKNRWARYPEIHYFFNNPIPITFHPKKVYSFSAKEVDLFKDNDLFTKMLTLKDTNNLLRLIFLIVIGVGLGVAFLILHTLELI